MGAGNAHSVFILLHHGPPGLRPLKDRDALLTGRGDLRVVVPDSGGADDELRPLNGPGAVAHRHGDAQGAQMLHTLALAHVAALDQHAHAVEHLRQGGHGHAADAGEMDTPARGDIVLNFRINMGHGKNPSRSKIEFDFYTECIIL